MKERQPLGVDSLLTIFFMGDLGPPFETGGVTGRNPPRGAAQDARIAR